MKHACLAAALVLLLFSMAAAADAPMESDEEYWGRPVVVTATRSAQDLTNVAANVTVLTEAEIGRSASLAVDDLLRQIPGFTTLRQTSSLVGSPTGQALSLRGVGATSASRTLVMVDGVPITDPYGGWIVWNRIPMHDIARIEMVRGGGSGIWGNLAMGGIVNIITERPERRRIRFTGEGGTESTRSIGLSVADRIGPWTVSLGGRYFDTDGYYLVREDQRTPVDTPSYTRYGSGSGRVDYHLSDRSSVYVSGDYYDEFRGKGTPLAHAGTVTRTYGAGADLAFPDGSEWDINLFATAQSYDNYSSRSSRDGLTEAPSTAQYDVPSSSAGSNVQWSKTFGGAHQIVTGADYQRIEAESDEWVDYSKGIYTTGLEVGGLQQLAGAYVQEIYSPSLYWRVIASARLDYMHNSDGFYRTTDLTTGETTVDDVFDEATETSVNPSLGVVYHVDDRLSFRSSAYRAFRAPTVNELYRAFSSRGVVNAANPALDPERLAGVEAGVDYNLGRRFLGRVTGFWNEVENTITQRTLGVAEYDGQVIGPCGPLQEGEVCRLRDNVGRLLTAGVELELTYRPFREWTFSGSYVFDHTEIFDSDDPALDGKWQRQVPRHQFVLKAAFHDERIVTCAVQGRYVGERYEDDLNAQEVNELFVVDLHLARAVGAGREVFLNVENVADKEYEVRTSSSGIVEPGMPRLVHGGVRIRI